MSDYLIRYLGKYKWWYIIGATMIVGKTYLASLGPEYVRRAVDYLKADFDQSVLIQYILLIVLFSIGTGVFLYAMRRITIGASRLIENDIRNDFFSKLQSLDMNFFHHNRIGDLMARSTNDLNNIRSVFGPAVMYSVNLILSFLVYPYMMFEISPQLTLWGLIPIPIMAFVVYTFGQMIYKMQQKIQAQYSTISNYAQENLAGIRVIKSFALEEEQTTGFHHLNHNYFDKMVGFLKIQNLFHPSIMFIMALGHAAILYIGGQQVVSDEISIGEFTAFYLYLGLLTFPSIAIGWVASLYQTGASSVDRIQAILNTESSVITKNPHHDQSIAGKICFDNLSFKYPKTDQLVLDQIDLTIEKGQTLGIVGSVGSGKTTLINLITRSYQIDENQLKIDDKDINGFQAESIAKQTSIVNQESFLFSDTIKNNILFSDLDASDEEINTAIEKAQLSQTIESLPEGIDTILGERGINLSGGQKQRTAIARALLKKAPILILDDCLSAVDTETEKAILETLKQESADKTTIIISHRISSLMHADQIIVMENGKIIEHGNHNQLIAIHGHYSGMYEKQLIEQELNQLK